MAQRKRIADDVRAAVVDAYRAGERVTEIEARWGLKRATVYWLLRQAGVEPNRTGAREETAERHPSGSGRAGGGLDLELVVILLQQRVRDLEAELAAVGGRSGRNRKASVT